MSEQIKAMTFFVPALFAILTIYLASPYNAMNTTPSPNMNEIDTSMTGLQQTKGQGPMHRWWPWLLLLVILVGVGVYFYLKPSAGNAQQNAASQGGSKRGGGGAKGVTPVVAAAVKTGDINVYLDGLGAVTPLSTVTIKTHVDGELMKVLFTEGQTVKRGQFIAEIDPRPSQVLLEQAEGTMAHDQALLKNAQVDLERYKTLFKQDSIAEQQLATQDALVRQYEGQIKVDRGQIDSAKLQLTYCHITSPVNGRVGLRQVDPGNIVHAADATGIVVITQLQPITVVFSIPEDNIPGVMQKLQAGNKLAVDTFDRSQKNKLATGSLLTVDNQIDPTTGTVKLKAQFANDDYALFPSQFVNARLLQDTKHGVTLVPSAGVQRGSQGTYVYVVKADHTVGMRLVKVGITEGDNSAIDDGLAAGETVVIDGADKLRDGSKVEATMKDAKSPAGSKDATRARSGQGRGKNGAADKISAPGGA